VVWGGMLVSKKRGSEVKYKGLSCEGKTEGELIVQLLGGKRPMHVNLRWSEN